MCEYSIQFNQSKSIQQPSSLLDSNSSKLQLELSFNFEF
jgi:hypothetical protein